MNWISLGRRVLVGLVWVGLGPVAVWAQALDGTGLLPSDHGTPSLRAPEQLVSRMDQIWEVESLMGQPVAPGEHPVRVLMRPGSVQVLDGCNRFAGRFTHDPQGTFRLSSLRGTHNDCSASSRPVATFNSALVMANRYQVSNGAMVLHNGDMELARLVPSRHQDEVAKDEFRFSLVDAPRAAEARPTRQARAGARKGSAQRGAQAKGRPGAKATKAGRAGAKRGQAAGRVTPAKAKPKR